MNNNRIYELDGIRGIAILLVILFHYVSSQLWYQSHLGNLPDFLSLLQKATWGAWSGVDVFFVLSGYLIIGMLLDNRGNSNYYKYFYVRRMCRIFPLYYMMVVLYVLVPFYLNIDSDWLFSNELPYASYLTFTQNYFMTYMGFGGEWLSFTWSLAIEEQFYLLIPVLVVALSRGKLLMVFCILIILAPVFRFYQENTVSYLTPHSRADAILLGGVVALLMRNRSAVNLIRSRIGLAQLLIAISIVVTVCAFAINANMGAVMNHLSVAIVTSLLIIVSTLKEGGSLNALLSNRVLVWFGSRSYALYLFHQPVSGVVHYYAHGGSPYYTGLNNIMPTVISFVIVIIISELSYRYFEMRFVRYGRNITRSWQNRICKNAC